VDRFDRIYRLHRILAGRRTPIPFEDLREALAYAAWRVEEFEVPLSNP